MTVRVALVDDQPMFRAGIAMVLDSQPDLEVVGQAEDGDQVTALVADVRPDVVVMDVRMPQVDGVIVCVRAAHTTRDEARAAKAALDHLPSRSMGAVVTGIRPHDDETYEYYYAYGR